MQSSVIYTALKAGAFIGFLMCSGAASTASANDFLRKPADVAAPSWTGFYAGVNAGYGRKDSTVGYTPNDDNALASTCGGVGLATCIPPAAFDASGAVAGGQIGYNYQLNSKWLVGIEADYDWSNIHGTGTSDFSLNSAGFTTYTVNETLESFGTLRGRLGYIPEPSLLIYGTGGLAYGKLSESASAARNAPAVGFGGNHSANFSYVCEGTTTCFDGSLSKTMIGWTIGAGAEYAVANNFTVKAEYIYANLGNAGNFNSTATETGGLAPLPSSFSVNSGTVSFNLVRIGLNYKFN